MKIITNSLSFYNSEDAQNLYEILETASSDSLIQDVDALLEYNNIIFDCDEEYVNVLVENFIANFPNICWSLMLSEGEVIQKIISYDGEIINSEIINMTMEQISQQTQKNCNTDCKCDKCKSCDKTDCKKESLDDKIRTVSELMLTDEKDNVFLTLCNTIHTELERYVEEQVDEEIYDEVISLFYDSLTRLIIFAVAFDSDYSDIKHEYVKKLFGSIDKETAKSIGNSQEFDDCIKTAAFWKEAKLYTDNRLYDALMMVCIFVCCLDNDIKLNQINMLKNIFEH